MVVEINNSGTINFYFNESIETQLDNSGTINFYFNESIETQLDNCENDSEGEKNENV